MNSNVFGKATSFMGQSFQMCSNKCEIFSFDMVGSKPYYLKHF